MVKFCDECIDSSDWIEEITGYRPVDDLITINELNEIAQDPNKNGGDDGLANHWDYPLSEIPNLVCDGEDGTEYVIVSIQNNVSKDVSNEDIEEYQDFMDSYVNINSELYKQCSMALMALTAYAYKCDRDVELGKWIENCQSRKWQNLSPSQEVNFKYMKRSFDNFVNANGGAA